MIISNSPTETELIAKNLSSNIKSGSVILLFGNMGSGKTTLAGGIIKGLGVKEIVSSPTFSIMKEYLILNTKIYHIDLYRLNNMTDIINSGLEDYLYDNNAIILIEWPERIKNIDKFFNKYQTINIVAPSLKNPNLRHIIYHI
jgi:tRNA threonylcarbamoyladenosine biosynthesis protein TsaE